MSPGSSAREPGGPSPPPGGSSRPASASTRPRPRQVAHGGAHPVVAAEERRAPVAGRPAERLREDRARAGHLVADLVVAQRLQVGMRDRVVRDLVTGVGEPPHGVGAPAP